MGTATTTPTFRFNREQYYRLWEADILSSRERVELLNGQLIEMAPIGDEHAACTRKLDDLLRTHLKRPATVSIQTPVVLNDFSEPEPDVTVLLPRDDYYASGHPGPADILLLIEVADSTLEKDQQVKMPQYAAAGIREYWILDLQNSRLEVYTLPTATGYRSHRIFEATESFSTELLREIRVKDLLPIKTA